MKFFLPEVVFDSRWKRLFRRFTGLCCLCLFWGQVAQAQVTGTVYRDFNENGVREQPGEIGVGSVTITVFNISGGVVGTATSSTLVGTQGQYSIPLYTTGQYRVQFANLPAGYYSGPQNTTATGGSTAVQFITIATTPVSATANLGINYPADYCQAAPTYLVPCYVNGDPLSTTVGAQPSLVSVAYSATGVANASSETAITTQNAAGSVFGVAYQRVSKVIFTSAFVKRHSGLGTGGAGAIYMTRPGSNSTTVFATLPLSITVADNATRGLPNASTTLNRDPLVFDQVGKTGLGDLEISDDGTELYTVNLSDRRLYKIPINNPTSATPTAGTPVSYALPTSQTLLSGSVFRPFAVKYYRGHVYVGGVTTNEAVSSTVVITGRTTSGTVVEANSTPGALITRDTTGLKAVVYEFDPSSGTFSTSAVLAFSLTYRKGATNNDKTGVDRADYWLPWTDVQPGTSAVPSRFARADVPNCSYPQPWLTGLEFDVDGSMILSIRDRFADQYGNRNYAPTGTGTQTYRAIGPGDLLRAGKCDPGVNKWSIEYNASVCNGTATAGKGNQQGVGGGEYYYGDYIYPGTTINNVFAPYHVEMSQGALALLPGSGEVSSIGIDPYLNIDAGGIRRFNNQTGFGQPSTSIEVFYSGSSVATLGKANGLGDVDLSCNAAPIEIGNRLWVDLNKDGTQDANETGTTGLSSLTVTLYQNSTLLVGSTTVRTDGTYYFNTSNVTLNGATGLLPNTLYQIRLDRTQAGLSGYALTTANAGTDGSIDNDATVSGTNAVINLTTGDYGQNNHSFDFGFTCPSQNLTASNNGPLTCLPSVATVTASASLTGLSYQWSGPGGFNTAGNSFTTTTPGTYTVTAAGVNGCYSTTTTAVSSNTAATTVEVNSLTLTCSKPSGLLAATVSGGNSITYRWTGPGSFTSSAASFTTATAGTYSLTVNNSGNCPTIKTTTVSSDTMVPALGVNATSSTLTCSQPSSTLTADGAPAYFWTGPGNFTSSAASFATSTAGVYSVTATGSNACISTTAITISANIASPSVTLNSLTLNCSSQRTLTASVTGGSTPYTYVWDSNPYNTIQWQSPPTTPSITVPTAATYTVTVTGANGCVSSATTVVGQDLSTPQNLTAGNNGPLTCIAPTATVSGGSTTSGVTYRWSGPNSFTANTASFTTAVAGTYTITATGLNSCISTATTTVNANSAVPTITLNSLTLTCAQLTGLLTATVSGGISPYSYQWSGPASFASTASSFTTATAGTYSLTVTGANGCYRVTTAIVQNDTGAPNPTVGNTGPLTCSLTTVNVNATSSAPGVIYRWSGPASFTSTADSFTTSTAGTYSVTATGTNGCVSTTTTTVQSDTAVPTVTANSSGTLACAITTITLTTAVGNATTPAYLWSTMETTASIIVSNPGIYSVQVTSATGCAATTTVQVQSNAVVLCPKVSLQKL